MCSYSRKISHLLLQLLSVQRLLLHLLGLDELSLLHLLLQKNQARMVEGGY